MNKPSEFDVLKSLIEDQRAGAKDPNHLIHDRLKASLKAEAEQLKALKYTYHVIWSVEDNEYVGLCDEFPSLSWLDAEQTKAFSGIIDLVAEVLSDQLKKDTL